MKIANELLEIFDGLNGGGGGRAGTTTEDNGHWHMYRLERAENFSGKTINVETGHQDIPFEDHEHEIKEFKVMPAADGHTHKLSDMAG